MKTLKLLCLIMALFCAMYEKTDAQCNASAYWLDSISQNGSVHFTAYDTATISTYYAWNFGDGQTSNDLDPTHQYTRSGTYDVCLYVVYSGGTVCVDSLCRNIQVSVPANCAVTISDILQPQPPGHTLSAVVNGNSTSGISYHWSPGGQTSSSISVSTSGTYCVTVTNTVTGCYAYACDTLNITTGTCGANYTYQLLQPFGNVQFTNTSTASDSITGYSWYFGDNTSSDQPSPLHVYTSAGVYYSCLRIQTVSGCVSYQCDSIHIASSGTCAANFTYQSLQAPGNVQFTSTSTASDSITSYYWSWGDNTTSSTQKNPLHVYPGPGVFRTCLYIRTISGCESSFCDSVNIIGPNPCDSITAGWTYSATGGVVRFVATDTANGPTHHDWSFGDGSPEGFTSNVLHTYTASGTYHVCQYVYVESGNAVTCSDSSCYTIQVTVPANCDSLSSAWTSSNLQNGSIQFYSRDTATGSTHHIWTFGDGTTYSTSANPIHAFASSGTYHVCQLTYIVGTACSDSTCDNITVTVPPPNCNGFHVSITSGLNTGAVSQTLTAVVIDSSSTAAHTYKWSTNQTSSSITVTQSGRYCVTVSNAAGCSADACDSINIVNNCSGLTAYWTSSNLSNGNVHFVSADTVTLGVHHVWNFGDNTSSSDVNPTHAYSVAGNYHVCLYVYVPGTTCLDSFCMNIQAGVGNNCGNFHTEISVTPDTPNTGYKLTALVSEGTSPYSYSWSPPSNAVNSSYIIVTRTGYYCVTVTDANGCTTSACDSVHISTGNPCSGLTAAWRDSILPNGNVQFIPTDAATNVYHAWSFGDSTTSGDFSPIHSYATAGTYHVCLYVYIAGSTCVDSSCNNIQAPAGTSCAGFGVSIQDVRDSTGNHTLTAVVTAANISVTYAWSTGQTTNPIYIYHSGNYCVKATAANGCYAYTCDSVIVTTNPCQGLSASWTPTYQSSGGIQFNGVPNPVPVSNYWVFGDGTTSSNLDPIHYYAQPGLYTVCHYVYIPGTNCVDSACRAIQSTGSTSCHAAFTYQTTSTAGTDKIYFTSTSTSNDSISAYSWSYGDGQTGSGALTDHIYGTGGTYYACLTITTVHGCTSTHCDSITVGGATSECHASFTWHAINCLTVEFENTSPPGYTLQRWIYGDGTTDTVSNPHHTYTQSGTYTVILHSYYPNCYSFDTMVVTLPTCANNDTVCGVVFEDLNNDGVMDNGETGILGVTVHVGNVSTTTDSSGNYQVILPPGPIYIYIYTPAGCIPTLPLSPDSSSTAAGYNGYHIGGTAGTNCGYNFGVDCNVVHVCGEVYFDANNNGVLDSTENGILSVHVIITDSAGHTHNAFTNSHGEYCETVPAGNYTITIVDPYATGTVTPSSISLNATGAGQTYGNNNFGVYVQPGSCDLSIDLTAHSTVTAGFPAWYSIEVCNVGASTSGGTVSMFFDPALTFNYAYPSQASYNASTGTLTWNVSSLLPGECSYIWVAFKANVPLQIGQPVFTLVDINPGAGCNDVNFNNNVDTVQQVVTGSWDPNSKVVSPIGVGPQGYIAGTGELKYTINFQNTGTAQAVNIVVQDALSTTLNPETFRMVGASNPYTMEIEGNLVIWKFSNIMLPDSSANEQQSHGYITFAITPNQGLAQATQIQNTADIYFDYNQGVATNTTLNTIDIALAVNNLTVSNATITLQPNPFKDYTTIRIDGAEAPYQLVIYDLLGNTVNSIIAQQNVFTVDRGSLAAGMYLYEVIQQDKVIGKGKMVAQ